MKVLFWRDPLLFKITIVLVVVALLATEKFNYRNKYISLEFTKKVTEVLEILN